MEISKSIENSLEIYERVRILGNGKVNHIKSSKKSPT